MISMFTLLIFLIRKNLICMWKFITKHLLSKTSTFLQVNLDIYMKKKVFLLIVVFQQTECQLKNIFNIGHKNTSFQSRGATRYSSLHSFFSGMFQYKILTNTGVFFASSWEILLEFSEFLCYREKRMKMLRFNKQSLSEARFFNIYLPTCLPTYQSICI